MWLETSISVNDIVCIHDHCRNLGNNDVLRIKCYKLFLVGCVNLIVTEVILATHSGYEKLDEDGNDSNDVYIHLAMFT